MNMLRGHPGFRTLLTPLMQRKNLLHELCVPLWNLVNDDTNDLPPSETCPTLLALEPGGSTKRLHPLSGHPIPTTGPNTP